MADFTITVSNSLVALGPAPTTKWNGFSWGQAKWGEGTTGTLKEIEKLLSEAPALSDAFIKGFELTLSNSLTATFEGSDQTLTDGSGYTYLFPGPVTDGDERSTPTYTSGTIAAVSWSSGTAASTTWS